MKAYRIVRRVLCLILFFPMIVSAEKPAFEWKQIEPGYMSAEYDLGNPHSVLRSTVRLLKFNPKQFSFHAVSANTVGEKRADVKRMVRSIGGIAGINANFFDERGAPLGLVISDQEMQKRVHAGGNLLSGIFYISDGHSYIVNREQFKDARASLAIQAGPRLIVSGSPIRLNSPNAASRRSGIAITEDGELILYATELRFPGASLLEIQNMLLNPALKVADALNFDGGGSSQLYYTSGDRDDFVSGGDTVPVAFVVKRKAQ